MYVNGQTSVKESWLGHVPLVKDFLGESLLLSGGEITCVMKLVWSEDHEN